MQLKSTNNSFFEDDPYKGVLKPNQTITITVTTVGNVNAESARDLAQKNKFMIEYISLNSNLSIDEAMTALKRP